MQLTASAGKSLVNLAVYVANQAGIQHTGAMKKWGLMTTAIVVTLVLGLFGWASLYPALNDVSSDLADPPNYPLISALPENTGRSFDFPPANVELLKAAHPEDLGFIHPQSPELLRTQVRELILKNKWQLVTPDDSSLLIEAIVTTPLMRFKDDFVVRLKATADGGTRIDFRSRSRLGKSDLGANAKRIRQFRSDLQTQLATTLMNSQ